MKMQKNKLKMKLAKKISKPELIAPVGNWPMLTAAIDAGADAVYLGVNDLNMRITARSFEIQELKKVAETARKKKVKVYLTLNTIIYDNERKKVDRIIKEAKDAKIDAIICWDVYVIQQCIKAKIPFHISTQAGISNYDSLKFYAKLGAKKAVLARELSLEQLKNIVEQKNKDNLDIGIEVFIHGAMCVSISGRCFLSQELFGKSANRGDCLQPCRRPYKVINEETGKELRVGNNYILSPKDLCALPFTDRLIDAGIESFKIEGRNRSPEYVKVVTSAYKKVIDDYLKNKRQSKEKSSRGADATGDAPSGLSRRTFSRRKMAVGRQDWLDFSDSRLNKKLIMKELSELKKVYNREFSSGFFLGVPTNDDFTSKDGSSVTEIKEYVGFVRNYYQKINVAEIKVENKPISKGDEIYVIGNTTGVFRQKVESLEINHKKVDIAKKGERVALKLKQTARPNDKIFRIVKSSQ
ncbi:MAG: U32 family peptidase [Nanoarchaeota archaeon]|nr:U32 family peptidase [Nanoarchaeota archaeon]